MRRSGARVEGVTTSAGAIDAPVVVLAAGAWSGGVGRLAGIDVPVSPLRRSKFITAPFPFERIPEATPFVIDTHQGISLRREGAGLLLGIGRRDEGASFETQPDWSLSGAARRAGGAPGARAGRRVADARLGRALRDDTGPDRHPERGAGVDGLHVIAGFSGHGFMHGPIAGQLMAELITDGRATTVDIAPLGLDRFARGELAVEPLTFT